MQQLYKNLNPFELKPRKPHTRARADEDIMADENAWVSGPSRAALGSSSAIALPKL